MVTYSLTRSLTYLLTYLLTYSLTHSGDDAMVSLLLYSLNDVILSLDTRFALLENCVNLANKLGFSNIYNRLVENIKSE